MATIPTIEIELKMEILDEHSKDRWFIPDKQEEDNFTVIVESDNNLYKWSDKDGLQKLKIEK